MIEVRSTLKVVAALLCLALIATACSNVEKEQADPRLPEPLAGAAVSDVGFIDVGENDFDEPPLVVPADPPPIEDWPEGVLAVGEGLDVTLPAPAEAPISVTLALPPRPTEDALPAAIWERDEEEYELVLGHWDQDLETITVLRTEFSGGWAVWLSIACIVDFSCVATTLAKLAIRSGELTIDEILESLEPVVELLSEAVDLAKDEVDEVEWLKSVYEWLSEAADWVADSLTGRTDPPDCRNDAPSWASLGEHPNWIHTCLESRINKSGEVQAELVVTSNRRYNPMAVEIVPSAAYVNVDDQPEWVRRGLAHLTGMDVENWAFLPWDGSYQMAFSRNAETEDRHVDIASGPTLGTFLFGMVLRFADEALKYSLKRSPDWLPVFVEVSQCVTNLNPMNVDLDPNVDLEQMVLCALTGIGEGFQRSKHATALGNVGDADLRDRLMRQLRISFPRLAEQVAKYLPWVKKFELVRLYSSIVRDSVQTLHDADADADRRAVRLTLHGTPSTSLETDSTCSETDEFEVDPTLTVEPSVVAVEGFDYEFTYTGSGFAPNQVVAILPILSDLIDLFSFDPYSWAYNWLEITPDACGDFAISRTEHVAEGVGGLSFIINDRGLIDAESRRLHPGVTIGPEGTAPAIPESAVDECLVRCDVALAVHPKTIGAPGPQEFTVTASGEIYWGQLTVCGVEDWSTFISSDANCELVEESVSATRREPFEITFEFDVLSEGLWIQLEDYAGDISHAVLSARVWVGGEPRPTVSVDPSVQASGPTRFSVSGSGFTHPVFVIPCSPIESWPSFSIEAECDLTSSTATHVGRDGDFSVSVSYDVPAEGLGILAVTDAARTEAAYVNIPGRGSLP